jgi:hypothetical protein
MATSEDIIKASAVRKSGRKLVVVAIAVGLFIPVAWWTWFRASKAPQDEQAVIKAAVELLTQPFTNRGVMVNVAPKTKPASIVLTETDVSKMNPFGFSSPAQSQAAVVEMRKASDSPVAVTAQFDPKKIQVGEPTLPIGDEKGHAAVVEVTRVAFIGLDTALVGVAMNGGPGAGSGVLVLLKYYDGQWRVVHQAAQWSS